MSSYDNNNPNNTYHQFPFAQTNATATGAPASVQSHALKDANSGVDQPRVYASPSVQIPSYYPANGQYGFSQAMVYPPPQVGANSYPQQQQLQQAQQQHQQQQQNYYDPNSNNYYIIPPGNPNPNNPNNQVAGANNLGQVNYYNAAYGQYHPPPQMQVAPGLPVKQQSQSTGSIPTVSSTNQQQQSQQPQSQSQPQHAQAQSQTQAQTQTQNQSQPQQVSGNLSNANASQSITNNVIFPNFCERLQQLLPPPPLSRADPRPEISLSLSNKRAKRKSKFSKQQDDLIVSLKKKGKSWVEIAEISQVGSYLAARNRYQVIVGQQGNNNSSSWDNEDKDHLQRILDAGEIEKWRFISTELNKATSKNFTDVECREIVRMLFWSNPGQFSVNEDTINECIKEKKLTEKSVEQREQGKKKSESSDSGSTSSSSSKKRKSSSGSEIKKEEGTNPNTIITSNSSINSISNQINPTPNTGNVYYSGAPQLSHGAYQRYSVTPNTAVNNSGNPPANQYSYPKHFY